MKWILTVFTMALSLALFEDPVVAQMVEVKDEKIPAQTQPSQDKARSYFKERKASDTGESFRTATQADTPAGPPRYLVLHLGTFFADQGYHWGKGDQESIGKLNIGLDYRLGEWVNSADLAARLDYTTYDLDEGPARKLTVMPIVTFPDANSRFPLYFGGGAGVGFFVKQLRRESSLSLDYSLFGGARFLNLYEQLGFLAEVGIKNHFHLFSDGQFNGVYVNVGIVFTF